MRIAINHRFGTYEFQEGYGVFSRGLANALATQFPDDEYFLLTDRIPVDPQPLMANQQWMAGGPPARHPLLWKAWYDLRLPTLLRESRAEVFFSPDGFCSLTTRLPQVLVIHDLAFLRHPDFLSASKRWYYRHYTPRFIKKAKRIVTVSECSREDILKHYPYAKGKIDVIHNAAAPEYKVLDWDEREKVKESFTGGLDYFLYVGAVHPRKNLVNLLKGFSAFKKRQHSSMKLVIAGRMAWQTDAFEKALSTFKFRDDVILTGYLPLSDLARLTGSAYALVYPSLWEGFGLPVLEAMQAGVPVLASGNSAVPEVSGDAALYFDPTDPAAIGNQMMCIFKEENRRKDMIARGLERARKYTWAESAARLHGILDMAVKG